MDKKISRWAAILFVLACLTLLVAIFSMAIGAATISPDKVVAIILSKIPVIGDHITDNWTRGEENIIIQIRMPRVLLGLLVGASLALAGVTCQGIFKNPMADPYILGISSGASFGVAAIIVLGISGTLSAIGIPLAAFAGALFASFLVYNIARTHNKFPVETLLLSGIAVSAFFGALTWFLEYIAGRSLNQIIFWIMGALWSSNWDQVLRISPFFFIGFIVIFAFSRDLNVMLLGDDTATHLGSNVTKVKTFLLIISSLIAAAAVSVSGTIGFVGLIIPHIMRMIVGPDHRILVPSSVFVGAMFLTLADTFSRTIVQPTEMPVGIITAVIGSPFFIYLLMRRKKKSPAQV